MDEGTSGHRMEPGDRSQPRPTGEATPPEPLPVGGRAIAQFVTAILAIGIPLLTIPVLAGLPVEPFLLGLVYLVLLGGSVVTARRAGPGGVRQLFSGVLRWRIGWWNWAVAVAAIPVATGVVGLAAGTFAPPQDGWPIALGNYLFLTFVFGALVVNILEETAWQGVVQRHLTDRRGPLRAAALTAIPFAAVHIPLSFAGDVTMREALVATALLFVFAPAMRYLMGRLDIASGGSLLAVGVMHASFNASGQLGVTSGGWEHIAGLAMIALVALAGDAIYRRSRGAAARTAAPDLG